MEFFKDEIAKIKAFVFDVDGVLSRGNIMIAEDGSLWRSTNTKDGFAIQFAARQGFPMAIITGGASEGVVTRYKNLGIKHIYLKSKNKWADLEDFMQKTGVKPDEIMYMGDDIPDLSVMKKVRMPVCPKDAVPQVKEVAKYISMFAGGYGCVRDVIEQTLKSQNKWQYEEMGNLANS